MSRGECHFLIVIVGVSKKPYIFQPNAAVVALGSYALRRQRNVLEFVNSAVGYLARIKHLFRAPIESMSGIPAHLEKKVKVLFQ